MKKHILNILVLLLSSTAVLSCANELAFEEGPSGQESSMFFTLTISGTVSDTETGTPLEDIKINIEAFRNMTTVYNKTAYSDNNGRFVITFDGYRKPSSINATAEDQKGIYQPGNHEILIQWDSLYNIEDGIFYINDCDFYLQKNK